MLGGLSAAMTGGDIKEGIIFGAAAGLVGGGFQGYGSAKSQGLNPWTGSKTARDDGEENILCARLRLALRKGLGRSALNNPLFVAE